MRGTLPRRRRPDQRVDRVRRFGFFSVSVRADRDAPVTDPFPVPLGRRAGRFDFRAPDDACFVVPDVFRAVGRLAVGAAPSVARRFATAGAADRDGLCVRDGFLPRVRGGGLVAASTAGSAGAAGSLAPTVGAWL
jgi:hypothetical protein